MAYTIWASSMWVDDVTDTSRLPIWSLLLSTSVPLRCRIHQLCAGEVPSKAKFVAEISTVYDTYLSPLCVFFALGFRKDYNCATFVRGIRETGLSSTTAPSRPQSDDLVIIDTQGVHEVGLDFCGCGLGGLPTVQLLRARPWAATTIAPRTVATFAALRRFQMLSFELKYAT